MELKLNAAEQAFLLKVLDTTLREIRVEVRRTTTPEYHDNLEAEAKLIRGLIDRVAALSGASASS
jgi:hypothetical protein